MKKIEWMRYPKRDYIGEEGSIVAIGYIERKKCKCAFCNIQKYAKYYRVEVFNKQHTTLYISNICAELKMLCMNIRREAKCKNPKKLEFCEIRIKALCSMVEGRHILEM